MSTSSSPEHWSRVAAVFAEAADLAVADRPGFLDTACAGEPAVRAEVESLLRGDESGAALDDAVRRALTATAGDLGVAAPPLQRIGPYRLIAEIGAGGMGVVYLAEREDEFRHRVAIKVVRGLLGADGLRRLRAERQILASLEHPHIARLFDGGTTREGLPYLVMEYVDGVRLDVHCERQALSLRQRIELFRKVCGAVAHAHRNLIVHRDLKPSNILVAADGTPKLLDFGIAKLLDAGAVGRPGQTLLSQVMTPEYASPEQLTGGPITTASDIYSLGVLLYELLTGSRPPARGEPPRPSTLAGRRTRRGHELAGDLDTILLTALQREPERRYASVEHLSEDLQRHLDGWPVVARPSTWRYRAARFVGRHRAAVATAAACALVVIGFGIALTLAAARAARERNVAENVASMLIQVFSGSDPRSMRGDSVTARELLDEGVARIRRDLSDRPDVQARLLDAAGTIYSGLGLTERAHDTLQHALTTRQTSSAMDSQAASRAMWRLSETLRDRGQLAAAETMARGAYDMARRLVGATSPEVAERLNTLGTIVHAAGRRDEAERMFVEATQIFRDTLGPNHLRVTVGLANTSLVRRQRGDLAGAERLALEALAISRRVMGQTSAEGLTLIAAVRIEQGRLAEAEALLREALDHCRRGFGRNPHPAFVHTLTELAKVLDAQGGGGTEAAALRAEAAALAARLSE